MTVYYNAQLNYFKKINKYKKGVQNIKKADG